MSHQTSIVVYIEFAWAILTETSTACLKIKKKNFNNIIVLILKRPKRCQIFLNSQLFSSYSLYNIVFIAAFNNNIHYQLRAMHRLYIQTIRVCECRQLTSESPFIWVYNQTLPPKPNLSERHCGRNTHFRQISFAVPNFNFIYIYIKLKKLHDNPHIFLRNNAKTGNQKKLHK